MSESTARTMPDDSRFDILSAAAQCFMERGYHASSIDDVARSLGSTKGRVYHHFPSKADLFAEVFRTGMEMNYTAIEPYREKDIPAVMRWRHLATIHTGQMIRTKPFQRVVWEGVELHLRGATTPEQREVFARLLQYRTEYGLIFRKTIEEARDAGAMDFENLGIAAELMFMTLNSPIFWYSPRPDETEGDIDRLVGQIVTCAARGLGAS
ncbi:TetR/AcrR family transcriptional regulator [Mesorhizobium sp. CGMCC 1.15528]|uniref:TetR/AcrR family transcriptional regulator n=1 Tax=Mesorhizobium zhangyense TaxID=1776730 RepID=A0A7C9RB96_9HYPH|nr:TetR/AcrR family transcriptional regulator [Mesorhizobium zhangyense]NGN44319.1 TetR/AcrR family transcriptional regulator [Mesorhizobium zhangyense]